MANAISAQNCHPQRNPNGTPKSEAPIVDKMCLVVYAFMAVCDLIFLLHRLFLHYKI